MLGSLMFLLYFKVVAYTSQTLQLPNFIKVFFNFFFSFTFDFFSLPSKTFLFSLFFFNWRPSFTFSSWGCFWRLFFFCWWRSCGFFLGINCCCSFIILLILFFHNTSCKFLICKYHSWCKLVFTLFRI